jgi:transformation/transcription domain-associated protein
MYEYIHKLRQWRNKFEEKLDRRTRRAALSDFSSYLSEFRWRKFDDMEVPGQYLQHKDRNQDFVRVERFLPTVDVVRGVGTAYRRIKMRGHDGSVHAWAVQNPAARHCRREERIVQLFRQLNQTLGRKKESRRRDLQFTLPLMVPLAPHIRLVQEDTSYVTLQGVFEDHCRRNGMSKDDPIFFTMERLRAMLDNKAMAQAELAAAKLEVYTAVQKRWVGNTVALEYFQETYPDYAAMWQFRRQFSFQLATVSFMTYLLSVHQRYPYKMHISRRTGNVWTSEPLAFMANGQPVFRNLEPVPFRLTPNLQMLMGPIATEGIFMCAMVVLARCLTETEHELEHALALFLRGPAFSR